ncbi:MAG: hypothetical protein ABIA11_01525 [Patescibacteria group bacterium]
MPSVSELDQKRYPFWDKKFVISCFFLSAVLLALNITNVVSYVGYTLNTYLFKTKDNAFIENGAFGDLVKQVGSEPSVTFPSTSEMQLWSSLETIINLYKNGNLTEEKISNYREVNYVIGSIDSLDKEGGILSVHVFYSLDEQDIGEIIVITPNYTPNNTSVLGYNPLEDQDPEGFNTCFHEEESEEGQLLDLFKDASRFSYKILSCLKNGDVIGIFQGTQEDVPWLGRMKNIIYD